MTNLEGLLPALPGKVTLVPDTSSPEELHGVSPDSTRGVVPIKKEFLPSRGELLLVADLALLLS